MLMAMESKLSESRRARRRKRRAYEILFFWEKKSEAHLGITVNFQPSRRCTESGDFRDVVVFALTFRLLEPKINATEGGDIGYTSSKGW